jgi:mRNA-degrading endonuclease RelE of RelBE toxin-antitoxin system
MIRIFLSQRFIKSLSKLSPDQRAKAQAVLRAVMESFGAPHLHAGLGLRKLTSEYYECRIDLRWRIVLWLRGDNLLAYEVMDHAEIRAFLRRV